MSNLQSTLTTSGNNAANHHKSEIHRKVSARQMDSMDGDEIDKVCMKPIRIDATTANTNDSAAFQIKQFCCNASA